MAQLTNWQEQQQYNVTVSRNHLVMVIFVRSEAKRSGAQKWVFCVFDRLKRGRSNLMSHSVVCGSDEP